jgi:endoglucanase
MNKPIDWKSPVERYGLLKVLSIDHDNNSITPLRRQLCDKNGNPIQLKGMSSFGLQWNDGDWILTDKVFDVLAYDWKIDCIRLAMYITEDGYYSHPAELLARVERGIQLASERGIFIILDWHGLTPGDPSDIHYLEAGLTLPQYKKIREAHSDFTGPELFFTYLISKYENIQFFIEPFNEPNQISGSYKDSWKDTLLPYHQRVTDSVRLYDKAGRNIMLYGSDIWSQTPNAAILEPVFDPTGQNMMTAHIYAGEKGHEGVKNNIDEALNNGLAVFMSEWGTSAASGNGGPFLESAKKWCDFFANRNLSWCCWSLARKEETSSATLPSASDEPTDHNNDGIPDWDLNNELSQTGRFIRNILRGD